MVSGRPGHFAEKEASWVSFLAKSIWMRLVMFSWKNVIFLT